MRVWRWLDNAVHVTPPLYPCHSNPLLQSAYNLSEEAGSRPLPLAQVAGTSNSGCVSSSRRHVSPCCVRKASGIGVQKSRSQGTRTCLPREPITLLESETNLRNRFFSNNLVWNWHSNSTRDCLKRIDFASSFPQIGTSGIHQS